MNKRWTATAGIHYSAWTKEFRTDDRSLAEGEKTGRIKMLLDESERPIGVQIPAPTPGELISEWMVVMKGRVGLSEVASSVHPYLRADRDQQKGSDFIL
jgi:pyruvate/2-oxoglutarate dehydrogenase complex dihydrolipoamide dehydrogenase (E3) component